MKKVPKGDEPIELLAYRNNNPQNSWNQFTKSNKRRKDLQKHLLKDQGGLCAYCEIKLILLEDSPSTSDFRVEHFHPKSDESSAHNWHLDWMNILACCHGGSSRNVSDPSRFTENHAERSCDVPKANQLWDDEILNPLALPANISLFECKRSNGEISPINENCISEGVDVNHANASVERLQLNANRLCHFRKKALNNLNETLQKMCLQGGLELEDARNKLAKATLIKDKDGRWPAFFSAIRSYLGSAAELHLKEIHYDG